jgi:magnesium transporter
METPRSDTPSYSASPAAAELDDHRFQPHALPRSNIMTGRPDVLQMDGDNEHLVFDDADMHPDVRSTDHAPDAQGRRGPAAQCNVRDDVPSIRFPSRASSRSSPPNSVDAFADPEQLRRRDRAATVESQFRGDLGLTLQRTISRRPTFTEPEERSRGSADDTPSLKAEEDVCFPPPEELRVRGAIIDFDEMDEFVQMQNRGRQGERQRKMSTAGSFKSGYLPVLGRKPNPGTVVESVDDECVIDESCSAINEKNDNLGPSRAQSRRNMTPDRFSFFSSEMDTTIHAPQIGDLLCDDEGFYDLFHGGQGVWWLDCLDPSSDELAMLMKAFAIHPLTAEDIRVQETREKVELFKNYYFVCFRSFVQQKSSEDYMDPINIYIIVFGEGVLSFHFTPSNHSANVRRRIRQLRDYVALSSDWICYALIDDIVDSFAPVITDIENDSDAIEDAVFVARSEDYSALLKRIGDCRKKTMGGMRLLGARQMSSRASPKDAMSSTRSHPEVRSDYTSVIFKVGFSFGLQCSVC